MSEITDEIRWYRLFIRKTELEIKRIFETYREMGVEPILIKGWAATLNYPENVPRYFGDIDLAINSTDFDKCLETNRSIQLTSLTIDLHRECRHLDSTPWPELFARSTTETIDGTEIRILRPEDHLRVLCTHWLTDGGQYKERLWDIYYAVENRPQDFDWDLCLESVTKTRRNWVITALAITRKYLGLDASELPFASEVETIPTWIEKCLAKEWSTDVRLRALNTCLRDPKMLLKQIYKRIPPNPIQATIETEGVFDERGRLPSQIKSIGKRIGPSIHRFWLEFRSK